MRVQQVPNSPYFIHYDDNGYCCISKSKESQESIPESEMQEFLDAVANGLLYIEKERKSRYQRIGEAEKTACQRRSGRQRRQAHRHSQGTGGKASIKGRAGAQGIPRIVYSYSVSA
jgi:hypothetical protein